MLAPASSDSDPDPTSQIPWPSRNGKSPTPHSALTPDRMVNTPESSNGVGRSKSKTRKGVGNNDSTLARKRMSTMDLIKLSISMGGAQVAWTLELGYGTPFLLSLGLSEQLTSLVWLAGPISGLIAQPLIGAISDASTSKYRRRYWIVMSTLVLVVSTVTLAYCKDIASFFVDLFGVGEGSWDPEQKETVRMTAIWLAIVSFYLLDFSLNALQASLRNLLLDITPPEQLNAGNAWHSRMSNAGNIVGYGFGFIPLAQIPILRLLGGDQFRKFCVISTVVLVATVWVTCWSQEEVAREPRRMEREGRFGDVLRNIWVAITKLPKPIRRVCFVQVFAFMGWFPFLFYSTTYIGQIMAYEQNKEPDLDYAARIGQLAMLIYSIVAVVAGTLLPHLAQRDDRLLMHDGDEDEDAEISRLKSTVREWRAEAARQGQPLKLPFMPFFLRNIWTGALVLFSLLTFLTFFVSKVWQAIALVSAVGICWAVACWVPFAIIMEFLKERERDLETDAEQAAREFTRRPSHSRTQSTPAFRPNPNEREPLLRRRRSFDEHNVEMTADKSPVAGGTILGIHNLAIVFPQFIVALVASAIFRAVDAEVDNDPSNHSTFYGKTGVAWVLRFGGLCTLMGAVLARMVPPTRTEKEMRRRLAELKILQEEGTP
ncbi:MFS general substrate transporter [Cristinia sonorae]|uniref:MFS general substrate transporter n=1 Tax=Cristinia sonorae TaxID=1940300 RepID=A0A8K0XTR7_9AGAR|nr:MFS general substrate transporter [Cristinia sonorae]